MSRTGAASDPFLLTVPLQSSADAFAERHHRFVSELAPRPADIEGAALPEEVYTPAIERRPNPERQADRLAHRAREPHRPHGQAQPRRRHAGNVGCDPYHLVECRHFPAAKKVRL